MRAISIGAPRPEGTHLNSPGGIRTGHLSRLRAERAKLKSQRGEMRIAQGKRSAALGNGAIMNIPHSSFSAVPPRRGGTAEKEEWG